MLGSYFGTDGIRGIAGEKLTLELAHKVAVALAELLKDGAERPLVVIGEDTRISCAMLCDAMSAALMGDGCDVIKLGVIPTPAVSLLVKKYGASAGIMISASHNSFEYNGIKLFNSEGMKLSDEKERIIEEKLDASTNFQTSCLSYDRIGRLIEPKKLPQEEYIDFLLSTVSEDEKKYFRGKKIILDTANGASYDIAPVVYRRLGAEVICIGDSPDGININKDCGSTSIDNLSEEVKRLGADFGLAFDGDADRLIATDEKGKAIDGDKIMCIVARYLKEQGILNTAVTVTVMSNLGLHKFMGELGLTTDITKVGDRYVLESMLKTGSIMGGEQSGHMIFMKDCVTGDGILSSLKFVAAIGADGRKAGEVVADVVIYPQVLINVNVSDVTKKTYASNDKVIEVVEEINEILKDKGRTLIRPSGTEPLVRVMVEGEDITEIKGYAEQIVQVIKSI